MLSREEAEALADEVMERARVRSQSQRLDVWWQRTPWLLRCRALQALPPDARADVVARAQAQVHARHLRSYLLVTLSVVGLGALALLATGGPLLDVWLMAYVIASAVPSMGYSLLFVRPEVERLAKAHAADLQDAVS